MDQTTSMKVVKEVLVAERRIERLRQTLSIGCLQLIDDVKEKRRSKNWNLTVRTGKDLNNE